jgi:hypothetical protein
VTSCGANVPVRERNAFVVNPVAVSIAYLNSALCMRYINIHNVRCVMLCLNYISYILC